MQQSEAWLVRQGWKQGEGLGKDRDGIARPLTVKTAMARERHDFNHYSCVYEKALRRVDGGEGEEKREEKREEIVFDGMFVKAAGSNKAEEQPSKRVEDERELLGMCGNRTARRSVKRLKLTAEEEELMKKEAEARDETERRERDESREKKKKRREEMSDKSEEIAKKRQEKAKEKEERRRNKDKKSKKKKDKKGKKSKEGMTQ